MSGKAGGRKRFAEQRGGGVFNEVNMRVNLLVVFFLMICNFCIYVLFVFLYLQSFTAFLQQFWRFVMMLCDL